MGPFLPELDRTSFPDLLEQIAAHDAAPPVVPPRTYPGYPAIALPRCRSRWLVSLDRVLRRRRCADRLGEALPSLARLARLLQLAHGCHADGHGPTPSAGHLCGLELYLVAMTSSTWLPAGQYHYDRAGHHLSCMVAGAERADWIERVPSLGRLQGGSLLWVLVGDAARVSAKYGDRAGRFLLLEAGHLMQNLCLVSESVGWCTVPLGGFFEQAIARQYQLPQGDVVLYVGGCGKRL